MRPKHHQRGGGGSTQGGDDFEDTMLGGGLLHDDDDSSALAPLLEIPLRDDKRQETTEVVAFDALNLPHVDAVIDVLVDQEAAQPCWLRFAAAYFRQNRPTASEKILMTLKGEYQPPRPGYSGSSSTSSHSRFHPDRVYQNDADGRSLVGNSLAWLYIYFAREQRLARLHQQQSGGASSSASSSSASSSSSLETKTVSILNQDLTSTTQVLIPQLLAKADALLTQADKFSRSERAASITWINRAELAQEQLNYKLATMKQLSPPELDRALGQMDKHYQTSLEYRNVGMRALFGRANILFQRGQFKEARDMYTRGIAKYPGADPAPTRVALGLCFYELGQEGRAQECFERALELDPKSVDAQVCLAILEQGLASEAERKPGATAKELALNQLEAKRLRERVSDRLRLAYESDKFNPLLQVHLANNFFFTSISSSSSSTSSLARDVKRVGDLAKEAFNHTAQKKIQAEACYISARNYHAQGDTKTAASLYAKCLDCWPTFPLARYAHAQMELTQTKPDLSAALRAIQQVVESVEDDEDCLLMVGSLHSKMHSHEAALQSLRRVTEKNPHRVEAWLAQAVLEQSKYRQSVASTEEALRCYDKAIAALKFHKQPAPYELLNNVGALKFRTGNYAGALQSFDDALQVRGGGGGGGVVTADTVTLHYNRARALEHMGSVDEAERAYSSIIAAFAPEPHHESHMRLAAIAAHRGDYATALDEHLKPLLKLHHGSSSSSSASNADFLCFYAKLELEAHAAGGTGSTGFSSAEVKLKKLLEGSHHDPFARLMLGNQAFAAAQVQHLAAAAAGDKKPPSAGKDDPLSTALGTFRTVLKMNPTNMFAANGIGAAQAIRGRYEAARLILDKVREFADSSCPSVWVNLAHVYMQEESYDQAASLYDQCLKRFYDNRDAEVSLYLANALFHRQKYHEARLALLTALQHSPHDEALWFASATVDEAEAYEKLALDPKLRTVRTVQLAKQSLERALGVYSWIASGKKPSTAASTAATTSATSLDALARQEFAAAQALGLPHRPRAPFTGAPPSSAATTATASASVLAMARVVRAELEGALPDSADLAVVQQAQAQLQLKQTEAAGACRLQGRRPDAERAPPVSSSKLAFYSSRRIDQVKQEAARSAQYLAQQLRHEKKLEDERHKLEAIQREEEAKKLAVREEAQRAMAIKHQDREAKSRKLAETQGALARQMQEEEAERDAAESNKTTGGGSSSRRKSARPKKLSKKMQEAAEARKQQRFSDDEQESSSSSSSSSSGGEEGSSSGEESSSEDEEQEEEEPMLAPPELRNEEETQVSQACERLFEEEEEALGERDVGWFKSKLRDALGEEVMSKVDGKFVGSQVAYLLSRKRKADQMMRAALLPDDDGDDKEEEEAPVSKKRTKVIESSDEEEEEEEAVKPAVGMEEEEEEAKPAAATTTTAAEEEDEF